MANKQTPETPADQVDGPVEGEGSYSGTRDYEKSVRGFVSSNKDKIDKLGRDAEDALDGPGGDELRAAEAAARAHGAEEDRKT